MSLRHSNHKGHEMMSFRKCPLEVRCIKTVETAVEAQLKIELYINDDDEIYKNVTMTLNDR